MHVTFHCTISSSVPPFPCPLSQANVQRLLASELQCSPPSSPPNTSTLSPHPSHHHIPYPSHHTHTPHPSHHTHTSHEPHSLEEPHHVTSVDHHSTSSAPSSSSSGTPPTVNEGSHSSCSDLQWVDRGIGGHCQATVLTHPVYSWYVGYCFTISSPNQLHHHSTPFPVHLQPLPLSARDVNVGCSSYPVSRCSCFDEDDV